LDFRFSIFDFQFFFNPSIENRKTKIENVKKVDSELMRHYIMGRSSTDDDHFGSFLGERYGL